MFELSFFSFLYCWHSFVIDTQITWENILNHSSWVFHHHKISQSAWFELSCKCIPRELENKSWSKQASQVHQLLAFKSQQNGFKMNQKPNMTKEYSRVYAMIGKNSRRFIIALLSRHALSIWKTGSIALKRDSIWLGSREMRPCPGVAEHSDKRVRCIIS